MNIFHSSHSSLPRSSILLEVLRTRRTTTRRKGGVERITTTHEMTNLLAFYSLVYPRHFAHTQTLGRHGGQTCMIAVREILYIFVCVYMWIHAFWGHPKEMSKKNKNDKGRA